MGETWNVQYYVETRNVWVKVVRSRGVDEWPLDEAVRVMIDDWKHWRNNHSEYHNRLYNPRTGEIIPREFLV